MKAAMILAFVMLSSFSQANTQVGNCSLPTTDEVIQLNPYEEDFLVMEKPQGRCDSMGVTVSVASCKKTIIEKKYSCYQITEGTHVRPLEDYRIEEHKLCFGCR